METKTKFKFDIKHLILFALFLALLVQVFNTASLYKSFSHLDEPLRFISSMFIGVSAEFAIFVCIYAGSRSAGASFAILSFFVGIMFHNNFSDVTQIDFWYQKNFLSSSLMQIINSVLVWFLSELYVKKLKEQNLKTEFPKTEQDLKDVQKELKNSRESLDYTNVVLSDLKQEYEVLTQKKSKLEQDIVSLQKRKAGMSKAETE